LFLSALQALRTHQYASSLNIPQLFDWEKMAKMDEWGKEFLGPVQLSVLRNAQS
jgi:hypothetical protein